MKKPSMTDNPNWLDKGDVAYARFRPEYPAPLAAYL